MHKYIHTLPYFAVFRCYVVLGNVSEGALNLSPVLAMFIALVLGFGAHYLKAGLL